MRTQIKIFGPEITNSQDIMPISILSNSPDTFSGIKTDSKILGDECSEEMANYIDWLGLSSDQDFLVLSSTHHYYYDAEEVKNVKTVINIKELNHIKDLKGFLHSIFRILPQKSYFIGTYIDNKKNNGYELKKSNSSHHKILENDAVENGIISRIPFLNMLYSLLDSRTNSHLSRSSVSQLMTEHGFKVLNITELNDLSYFCVQRYVKYNN